MLIVSRALEAKMPVEESDRAKRIGRNSIEIWNQIVRFLKERGINRQISEDVSSDMIEGLVRRKPPLLVNYQCGRLPRELQSEALRRCFSQPKSEIRTIPLDQVETDSPRLARQETECDQDDLLEPVRRVLGADRTGRLLELCEQGNPRKFGSLPELSGCPTGNGGSHGLNPEPIAPVPT